METTTAVRQHEHFTVERHPDIPRMNRIRPSGEALRRFFEVCAEVGVQELEYVPYMRFVLAGELRGIFGEEFAKTVRNILRDRNTGAFTIGVREAARSADDYVKFATALVHLVGIPNHDAMSGKYYARFAVQDTDNSDSYLRQAYRLFTLHTDGTFVDEETDWLLMMKMEERHAVGGESRLLHLDDWEELDQFLSHPLARHRFLYKAPKSKNVETTVERSTFFEADGRPCICFIDQFVYPETIEQAQYLRALSQSMERSRAVATMELPVGSLVMINNLFWVHGRAPFEKNEKLYRELMRLRGRFADV